MIIYYDIVIHAIFKGTMEFAEVKQYFKHSSNLFDTLYISQHLVRRTELGVIIKHVAMVF